MIRRPPRSTQSRSSAASDVYKRQGYGFLRSKYVPSPQDIYVSPSQIKRFGLRDGDVITGWVRQPMEKEKYLALLRVKEVNGFDPEIARNRPQFEHLTPIFPNRRLKLETTTFDFTTRLIDLVAPLGRGQRGMIVSPPKAGKTTILKKTAQAITRNYPDVIVMVLLVCLLYTSDAADDLLCVDLGGRRIIK